MSLFFLLAYIKHFHLDFKMKYIVHMRGLTLLALSSLKTPQCLLFRGTRSIEGEGGAPSLSLSSLKTPQCLLFRGTRSVEGEGWGDALTHLSSQDRKTRIKSQDRKTRMKSREEVAVIKQKVTCASWAILGAIFRAFSISGAKARYFAISGFFYFWI